MGDKSRLSQTQSLAVNSETKKNLSSLTELSATTSSTSVTPVTDHSPSTVVNSQRCSGMNESDITVSTVQQSNVQTSSHSNTATKLPPKEKNNLHGSIIPHAIADDSCNLSVLAHIAEGKTAALKVIDAENQSSSSAPIINSEVTGVVTPDDSNKSSDQHGEQKVITKRKTLDNQRVCDQEVMEVISDNASQVVTESHSIQTGKEKMINFQGKTDRDFKQAKRKSARLARRVDGKDSTQLANQEAVKLDSQSRKTAISSDSSIESQVGDSKESCTAKAGLQNLVDTRQTKPRRSTRKTVKSVAHIGTDNNNVAAGDKPDISSQHPVSSIAEVEYSKVARDCRENYSPGRSSKKLKLSDDELHISIPQSEQTDLSVDQLVVEQDGEPRAAHDTVPVTTSVGSSKEEFLSSSDTAAENTCETEVNRSDSGGQLLTGGNGEGISSTEEQTVLICQPESLPAGLSVTSATLL